MKKIKGLLIYGFVLIGATIVCFFSKSMDSALFVFLIATGILAIVNGID